MVVTLPGPSPGQGGSSARRPSQGSREREVVRTVEGYRAAAMGKLGIHDVAGLVRYAVRHRMIRLDEE
jgi:hypothetical protein